MVRVMKTSIATTISITALLATGGFALASNTGIQDLAGTTSASGDAQSTQTAAVETTVTTTAAGSETVTYQIPEIGEVTLIQTSASVSFDSATAMSGWTYQASGTDTVSVVFTSDSRVIEFTAQLVNGQVVTAVVDNTPIPTTTPTSTTTPALTPALTPAPTTDPSSYQDDDEVEDESDDQDEVEDESDDQDEADDESEGDQVSVNQSTEISAKISVNKD